MGDSSAGCSGASKRGELDSSANGSGDRLSRFESARAGANWLLFLDWFEFVTKICAMSNY